ncbi:hypothetical protein CR513_51685, partial [Mucuna pruriens]
MDGYCFVNEVNNAKYVFSTMVQMGVNPDVHSYNYVRFKWWMKPLIFKEMHYKKYVGLFYEGSDLRSKMEYNGCNPDAITFGIIICDLFEKDENDKLTRIDEKKKEVAVIASFPEND